MVKDLSKPNERADNRIIRKLKFVHLKSTGLYNAQLVHLLPLCTIYQSSKNWYMGPVTAKDVSKLHSNL